MITQESIKKLKETVSLYDIINDEIKLKKSGSYYITKCPFHDEKTPSFKVKPKDNHFKCFGCGAYGDMIDFIVKYKSLSFQDAVRYIASQKNFELEETSNEVEKPQPRLEKIDKVYIDYFENRGISNNTLLRFKVTQANEWMPDVQTEIPVVCFNYFRDDELVNIKFRGRKKSFKLVKNAELIFYNLDAIKDDDTAVIVEGEIDCMSMYEAGIYNCVSVPNGAGSNNLTYIDNCINHLIDKKYIVIAVDNDDAGNKLKDELIRRLDIERCFYIEYPEGCKDANDILIKHGKDYLKSLIINAKPFPIKGIVDSRELLQSIDDIYLNGYPKGIKAGIEGFDNYFSLLEGLFTVVTGIPGSGKSEFIDFIMAKTALNHNWKWGIISFENTPPVFHATKIIEKLSGKAFDFRVNPTHRVSTYELEMYKGYLSEMFFFINTQDTDVTLEGLLKKIALLVMRKGIKGVLIDPWNYIEHKIESNETETQYISRALTTIRKAAIKLGIHIIVVAHPTKLNKTNNKYDVPTLYNISGSAHFFNKTDNGFTVYRDFNTNEVTVHIQKIRFSFLGKLGAVKYNYNTFTRQYEYLEDN
jgi:twinkle protein